MYYSFYSTLSTFIDLDLETLTQSVLISPLPDTILIFFGLLFTTLVLGLLIKQKFPKDKQYFLAKYLVFNSSIIGLGLFLIIQNTNFLLFSIYAGLGAFVAEYIFGKLCLVFTGKKLWVYNFYTFDNNHSTLLNIIPFVYAGYYFLFLYKLIA